VDEVLPALNDHSAYFQSLLGRVLEMKFTPRITFVEDKSFEEAQRIENILHDIQKKQSSSDQEEE
jgi:ribosome-binding factor A